MNVNTINICHGIDGKNTNRQGILIWMAGNILILNSRLFRPRFLTRRFQNRNANSSGPKKLDFSLVYSLVCCVLCSTSLFDKTKFWYSSRFSVWGNTKVFEQRYLMLRLLKLILLLRIFPFERVFLSFRKYLICSYLSFWKYFQIDKNMNRSNIYQNMGRIFQSKKYAIKK